MRRRLLGFPLVIAVLTLTGACGSSSSKSNNAATEATTTTTAAPAATTTASTPAATTAPVPAQQNQTGSGTLTIQSFAFNPNQLNTTVGSKITATNKDGFDHTWTADNGTWDSGHISSGQSYSFTFAKAGTYTYHCAIHTYMTGTVTVT